METLDWKTILSYNPSDLKNLSDQNKGDVLEQILWLDYEQSKLDNKSWRALFSLTQEILKQKTTEISNISSEFQQIQSERDSLKRQSKRKGKRLQPPDEDTFTEPDTASELENLQEMKDNVNKKNLHIKKLLGDIEDLENDNNVLKKTLSQLRDELSEATDHLTQLGRENEALKHVSSEQQEKLEKTSFENEALRVQIQELVAGNEQRDKQIDTYSEAIDSRVNEWKRILDERQSEINALKAKYDGISITTNAAACYDIDAERVQITQLAQTLKERNELIDQLETKLLEATREMLESTDLINKLTSEKIHQKEEDKSSGHNMEEELKAQLVLAHERCRDLQDRVTSAEEDALAKASEACSLLTKMKAYEEGEYGLEDAMRELSELNRKIKIRDKHISQLVRDSNKLQENSTKMELENIAFREKCNIPPNQEINTNSILANDRKREKMISRLQKTSELFEEYKLQSRMEIRDLKRTTTRLTKQIHCLGGQPDLNKEDMQFSVDVGDGDKVKSDELKDYENKYKIVVEENEALRRGMHEILESIQKQDGSGDVQIISVTLERLLEALDARHVSGWYHPAMRMQAEVNRIQGSNAELREALARLKQGLKKASEEATLHIVRNQYLENKVKQLTEEKTDETNEKVVRPSIKVEEKQIQTEVSVVSEIQVNEVETDKNDEQQKVIERKLVEEKQELEKSVVKYKNNLEEIQEKIEILESKYNEYEKHWSVIEKSDDEKNKCLQESAVKNGKMAAEIVVLNRKVVYVENNESLTKSKYTKLQKESFENEIKLKNLICDLNNTNEKNVNKIKELEDMLEAQVPMEKLNGANKEIIGLTEKYRETLEREEKVYGQKVNEIDLLKFQVETLKSDKNRLNEMLVKRMNGGREGAGEGTDDVEKGNNGTSKLSEMEIKLETETQRADHANNLLAVLKEQLNKSEKQCNDLEAQFNALKRAHIELQTLERDSREQLVESANIYNEFKFLKEKCINMEKDIEKLKIERKHAIEMNEIAEEKVQSQQKWLTTNEDELMSLRHQIIDLQSHTESNHIIARMSRELMLSRIAESETQTSLTKCKLELDNLNCRYMELQHQLEEERKQHRTNLDNSVVQISLLRDTVLSLQKQYCGSVPLPNYRRFIEAKRKLYAETQEVLEKITNAEEKEKESFILKEQYEVQLLQIENKREWLENAELKLNELKYRRLSENLSDQVKNMTVTHRKLEKTINQLEEEIITNKNFAEQLKILFIDANQIQKNDCSSQTDSLAENSKIVSDIPVKDTAQTKVEPQIVEEQKPNGCLPDENYKLKIQLTQAMGLASDRSALLLQSEMKLSELQDKISMLNLQLSQKDELLLDNKKAINELKIKTIAPEENSTMEINALKSTITSLQSIISQKEDTLTRYQDLLKSDRDEHSRAAVRFQDELKQLQTLLATQQQAHKNLQATCDDAQIETYKSRIKSMEMQMEEAKIELLALSNQLNITHSGAEKWKAVADKRMSDIEKLKEKVQQQFQVEKEVKERIEDQIKTSLHNKDLEIQQLNDTIEILKTEHDKFMMDQMDSLSNTNTVVPVQQTQDLQRANSQVLNLQTQLQVVRRQVMVVSKRERMAREEIRQLKGQLLKRPVITAKGDRTTTLREENLQKRVQILETDLQETKNKLEKESVSIEQRKIKNAEDLGLWEKQKRWQQMAEKLKEKLKERSEENDKLQQCYSSARNTISRLEREKMILIKSQRSDNVEAIVAERDHLESEVESLKAQLELQQHAKCIDNVNGLQDKLEAQQRRIAAMEIAGKGSLEVTLELEQLQATIGSLQRANLSLEAQNLQLQLDLEKASNESPRLKEQVQYLENYVLVLKEELSKLTMKPHPNEIGDQAKNKSVMELERTVLVLRSVVERLKVENKRLSTGRSMTPGSYSKDTEKLKLELSEMKQLYADSLKRVARLEDDLCQTKKLANDLESTLAKQNGASEAMEELKMVKDRLIHKSLLLDKVKVLLTRAVAKEKVLREQVSALKRRQMKDEL